MPDSQDEIAQLRARLAELETSAPPNKMPTRAPFPIKPVLIGFAAIGLFIVYAAISGQQTQAPASSDTRSDFSAETQALLARTPQPWSYSENLDVMTDKRELIACIDSTDLIQLDRPYEPVTARLCVQNRPSTGVDITYRLNGAGQILCKHKDCTARIRFDDHPRQFVELTEPADLSSNLVFLGAPRRLTTQLAESKLTRFEVSFYQAGTQTSTFPTSGLDLKRLGLSK